MSRGCQCMKPRLAARPSTGVAQAPTGRTRRTADFGHHAGATPLRPSWRCRSFRVGASLILNHGGTSVTAATARPSVGAERQTLEQWADHVDAWRPTGGNVTALILPSSTRPRQSCGRAHARLRDWHQMKQLQKVVVKKGTKGRLQITLSTGSETISAWMDGPQAEYLAVQILGWATNSGRADTLSRPLAGTRR